MHPMLNYSPTLTCLYSLIQLLCWDITMVPSVLAFCDIKVVISGSVDRQFHVIYLLYDVSRLL